jgi:hypothetical protein
LFRLVLWPKFPAKHISHNKIRKSFGCMKGIKTPAPAKLFLGLISGQPDLFSGAIERLAPRFGKVDLESDEIPFSHTSYYAAEFGEGLIRKWVSFEHLVSQDSLPRIKCLTNEIEGEFLTAIGKRRINLDPGYLTDSKLVLATTKDYAHRLYLGQGIYAEVTLHYNRQRGWQPYEWTYPDYREPICLKYFKQVRQIYLSKTLRKQIIRGQGLFL